MPASAYWLVWIPPLLWSGNYIVGRGFSETVPPFSLAFWRWVLAFAVVLPLAWTSLRAQAPLVRRHWKFLLAAGALGPLGYNGLIYLALQTSPALNVAMVNSATPLLIPVVSIVLTRERVLPRQWAGIFLSLLGVLYLVARGEPGRLLGLRFQPGDLWVLWAVLNWSLYSSLLRFKPPEMKPLVLVAGTAFTGALVLLPFLFLEMAAGRTFPVRVPPLLALVYVAVMASLVGYFFWNRSVGRLGPTRSGLVIHSMPVFVGVFGWILLGEPIRGYHLWGAVLIAAGIAVAMRSPRGRISPGEETSPRKA